MQTQTLNYISLLAGGLALLLALWSAYSLLSLNNLRKNFFRGRGGDDFENTLRALAGDLASLKEEELTTQRNLANLQKTLSFAIQKVGVVRFNPFGDGGGNFSFSLAMLDSHNNGLVITSMHGREQSRTYSKKITLGKTESQLTEEEMEAVRQAHDQYQKSNI